MKPRVLFIAEAASIAHVARPAVLASALDEAEYDIHFASSGSFAFCHAGRPWHFHHLESVSPRIFLERLSAGKAVFSFRELSEYVADDRRLIESVKPDLIVHDFRLSLGVSARLSGVPLLSICNAHWSPYRTKSMTRAPDLPVARLLGHRVFDALFRAAWPLADRLHCLAPNRLRQQHGLAPYPSLADFYCDGDVTMYADTPSLSPISNAPPSHVYLGPIVWSPELARPSWWERASAGPMPVVYVTLGSTGSTQAAPHVVDACRAAGLCCILATAGRSQVEADPPWVYAADFLPGSDAAALAAFVICNGGSATAYQALAQGRPVLGICSNLDQVLTMEAIAAAGAGEFMRASEVSLRRLRETIARLRSNAAYAHAARRVQAGFVELNAPERFRSLVAVARGTGLGMPSAPWAAQR